jgi:hypothetical protein
MLPESAAADYFAQLQISKRQDHRKTNIQQLKPTTKAMTLLTLLDIIVLTALALSAIAISWAIADYFRMAQDTESEGWDLPALDLDTRDLGGAEHRKAILKGGQL